MKSTLLLHSVRIGQNTKMLKVLSLLVVVALCWTGSQAGGYRSSHIDVYPEIPSSPYGYDSYKYGYNGYYGKPLHGRFLKGRAAEVSASEVIQKQSEAVQQQQILEEVSEKAAKIKEASIEAERQLREQSQIAAIAKAAASEAASRSAEPLTKVEPVAGKSFWRYPTPYVNGPVVRDPTPYVNGPVVRDPTPYHYGPAVRAVADYPVYSGYGHYTTDAYRYGSGYGYRYGSPSYNYAYDGPYYGHNEYYWPSHRFSYYRDSRRTSVPRPAATRAQFSRENSQRMESIESVRAQRAEIDRMPAPSRASSSSIPTPTEGRIFRFRH